MQFIRLPKEIDIADSEGIARTGCGLDKHQECAEHR